MRGFRSAHAEEGPWNVTGNIFVFSDGNEFILKKKSLVLIRLNFR